jgi:hypothetical protein
VSVTIGRNSIFRFRSAARRKRSPRHRYDLRPGGRCQAPRGTPRPA